MLTPRRPPRSYMTSLKEPTWFPSGRLDIRVRERGRRGRRARHLEPASSMWDEVNVPSPTVCHIPPSFNVPLPPAVCLSGVFIRSISVLLRLIHCLTEDIVKALGLLRSCSDAYIQISLPVKNMNVFLTEY